MPPSRIAKLTVRNFKSINGTLAVSLNGKNLVILGENGSGKTTLTRALAAVLDASRRDSTTERARLFEPCIDADPASKPGFICLELEGGTAFTLHQDGRRDPPDHPPVALVEAAKAKRVLDYKALLRTYFLHGTPVDLFDLLLEDVLPNEENTVSGHTYGEDWVELQRLHELNPRDRNVNKSLDTVIGQLNSGLELKLASVVQRAVPLLAEFDARLSFEITFGALVRSKRGQPISKGYARLGVKRGGQAIDRHTDFLNEARLSAVALCLHFAVLLDAPRTALGVLVLDDVLIGLDMDNRMPTLRLLEQHFTDWQTVMLTYDPQWFDAVREWSAARDWLCLKLHRVNDLERGTTLLDKGLGMLGDAQRLSDGGDLSAAANAARSAFESVLMRYFDKNGVPMPFKRKRKDLSLKHFWTQAQNILDASGAPLIDAPMKRDVDGARALILNPLSHDPNLPWTTREVNDALDAVRKLATRFGVHNP